MSTDPRVQAQIRINQLGWLIKSAAAMVEEEQRLIADPIPYASARYDRQRCALLNAAFECFECDELYDLAKEADPDWLEVPELPVRVGARA